MIAAMRTLYHLWLSPFCRKVRIVLEEKGLDFEMKTETLWQRRPEFLALNPAGEVPVLVEDGGAAIADSGAICEYIEEICPEPPLLDGTPAERAEIHDDRSDPRSHGKEGVLAFQLHAGKPMFVEFKDVRIKHLEK